MRKQLAGLLAVLVISACSESPTVPTDTMQDMELEAVLAFDAAGLSDPGRHLVGIHRLPRELQLTAAQAAQVKALVDAFMEATRADREALARIHQQAEEARKAGKPREEIARILAQGTEIRTRLAAAEQELARQIEAVLTAEQKAWLAAHPPVRCDRSGPVLTEAQRDQIAALIAAYQEKNKDDIAAVRAALEKARQAAASGANRTAIAAILNEVRAARERLTAAQLELARAIDALLTPEQRASRCLRYPQPTLPRTR